MTGRYALTILLAFVIGVLTATVATRRTHAQVIFPPRDYGLFCLYSLDTGGLWGVMKSSVNLSVGDPCPAPVKK